MAKHRPAEILSVTPYLHGHNRKGEPVMRYAVEVMPDGFTESRSIIAAQWQFDLGIAVGKSLMLEISDFTKQATMLGLVG